jgi:phosphomannomutase/phosphoglucomutase
MLKLRKNKEAAPQPEEKSQSASNPQGITAKGNALHKIAVLAVLTMLLPLALGFSYLFLVREPALLHQQADRVAASFATQQATNIHRLLTRMKDRIHSAAQSPLALSAIASASDEDIHLVEQAMLDYFPEAVSLRVIPVGEMGTADFKNGSRGLRNHIEVDLVRRRSTGEQTQPESYKFENRWLTSIADRVIHPRIADRQAVIIVTLSNDSLSEQLRPLDISTGRFTLEQTYNTTQIIAAAGSGGASDYRRYATVPDTAWRVAFTPSLALMDTLSISRAPLLWVCALCVVAALCALAILVKRIPRTLETQINRVISAADQKTGLQLAIPELVVIARQLRRATLMARRRSAPPQETIPQAQVETLSPQADELANPLFHSGSILDEEEEVLDLDLSITRAAATPAPAVEDKFPEHIFRAYDIRGNAASELSDALLSRIGSAIGTIAGEMGEQTLLVGYDGRISSPRIHSVLTNSLMASGRDIIDIGQVPTPLLYFATHHLGCRSGVMITGSHNPAEYNGLKIVLNQQTIAAGGIQDIRTRAIDGEFSTGSGGMIYENVLPAYLDKVYQDIAIAVPLKVVIDAGNGVAGAVAPQLFDELGCEVVPLYCDVDGNFPNHSPDTSDESNLADLVQAVQQQEADFGVAFDGDGDRLAVVTASGRIVRSDVLLMIFAQDVVSRNPGTDVVFDVKCSRNLTQLITRYGGRPVLSKTGHAFMKEKMAETGALLGGEFSGHMFFGERWYGFDDGIYAACRLAEILSTQGDSLDELIAGFPVTVNTPEILIPVQEEDKFNLIARIVNGAEFSSGKVNTMDGIRVDFAEGWGLVRASNTSPALTARFEADSEESLKNIMDEFHAQIALVEPDLELNF